MSSAGGAKARRAFTLIEVIITIALSVILTLAIAQLYVVYGRVILFQQSSIAVALDGSSIMDAARMAGMQARSVVPTHTFSGINYNSGTTTAIFELPAIDGSGAVIPNEYDYVGIHASSTSVYRLIDSVSGSSRISGEKRLTNVLGALSFTYDSQNFPSVTSVTVDATTSAMVRGEVTQAHHHEHVYLRNL